MSMQAQDFTVAVRQLVSVFPELTHAQARPLLKAMGLKIISAPGRISSEASAIKDYDVSTVDNVRSALIAVDLTDDVDAVAKRVYKEYQKRDAFAAEANRFNVSKSNFNAGKVGETITLPAASIIAKLEKLKAGETVEAEAPSRRGRKPKRPETKKVETPKVETKKRGRRPKVVGSDKIDDITKKLELVQKYGGVEGASNRVAELQAEIAQLESAIRVANAAVKAA